ncbi:site-2 protease family protein [Candidatus Gottesmanbacteria bacterium]|nr:site-2 protease family protein [Candidatus Gottesmanbacteria bacterium]
MFGVPTLLVFFLVLSILVFVHEFGHFIVAKKLGIKVEEFGFGLPPRVWGKKIGETIYSINLLPIGGFVRLLGEDVEEESSTKKVGESLKRYFFARSKKERAVVLLAGVLMNFILGVAIISYIFTRGVAVPEGVRIDEIMAQSPAEVSELRVGDVIVRVNNRDIIESQMLIDAIAQERGKTVILTVKRTVEKGVDTIQIKITPRQNPPADQGPLGVRISTAVREVQYPWYKAPIEGLMWAIGFSFLILKALVNLLYQLVTFQFTRLEVGGPIAIYKATDVAVKQGGLVEVLNLTGLLSINLAIFNLLPIPALDGGRLMFVVFEKFIGHRIQPKAERLAHQIGMILLLVFIALVTANDLVRYFKG